MSKEESMEIFTNLAGATVDAGFKALALLAGFPAAEIAAPFAKGLIVGLIQNCYNDCAQRTLSVRESEKLNRMSTIALQTFREFAEKDNVYAWEMAIDPAYVDYAYEVAEHATQEGIKQSERAKVDIIGRYYGRQLYKGFTDWQDMHQVITMTGMLTLRQIVMIRLIAEGFPGIDKKLCITNPSACVETNRLLDYGIWRTEGAAFGVDDSGAIRLSFLRSTDYAKELKEALVLDRLSEEDVKRTVDSLCLKETGDERKRKDYRYV